MQIKYEYMMFVCDITVFTHQMIYNTHNMLFWRLIQFKTHNSVLGLIRCGRITMFFFVFYFSATINVLMISFNMTEIYIFEWQMAMRMNKE